MPRNLNSVSSLVEIIFPFDENAALDSVMQSAQSEPDSIYFNKSRFEILNMWKQAAIDGTKMHHEIKTNLQQKIQQNHELTKEQRLMRMYLADNGYEVRPENVELRLYDPECGIRGTADAVLQRNGEYVIIDWKRCRRMYFSSKCKAQWPMEGYPNTNYWKYCLQINFYRYLFEKSGATVQECKLVLFSPERDNYIEYKVPDLRDKVVDILNSRNDLLN